MTELPTITKLLNAAIQFLHCYCSLSCWPLPRPIKAALRHAAKAKLATAATRWLPPQGNKSVAGSEGMKSVVKFQVKIDYSQLIYSWVHWFDHVQLLMDFLIDGQISSF